MSTDTSVPKATTTATGPAASRLGARGVSSGYGARTILKDLDLDVPAGVVTTIIGPNGCGKSTLLRTLARLIKPSGGTVVLGYRQIAR